MTIVSCSSSSTTPAAAPGSVKTLLSQKVKHVFVIVQENHSFDNYFGTYPGMPGQTVENLGTALAKASENQYDPATGSTVGPFTADDPHLSGGDQSTIGTDVKIDGGKMDNWIADQEYGPTLAPVPVSAATHSTALQVMAVEDCNTIPYLWYYANKFTLFDHYFEADTGPSTPGNIQLFAAQTGQSELASGKGTSSGATGTDGVPIINDDNPPPSIVPSVFAYTGDAATYQSYATMPVLLNPAEDAAASFTGFIPDDLSLEGKSTRPSIPWAWYEEGLTTGTGLVAHHVAPLYFDYVQHNASFYNNLQDNTPNTGIIPQLKNGTLASGGVYWIKGANTTQFGYQPANGDQRFLGDDDHPGTGNSDHQIAEAYVATVINTIAQSKYWPDSVIILTWDDMGGFYDHVPPARYENCPTAGGQPCGDGPRVPMLVISPFAKNGVVVHDYNDAVSVSKFIEEAFNLPTLGSLPDESPYEPEGPRDINSAIGDLTGALDPAKLSGASAPNPPSLAIIQSPSVPPAANCSTLGMTPSPVLPSPPAGYIPLSKLRSVPAQNDEND